MKKALIIILLLSVSLVFAEHYRKIECTNSITVQNTGASRPVNWIEVDSGLLSGKGVGQISVAMNNSNALWAHAINTDTSIYDQFTVSVDAGQTWTAGTFNQGDGLSQIFAIDENTCWAVFNTGIDQGLYKTVDSGVTWAKQGTAYGSSSFANVIHFFNDNDGFAQGDPVGGYYELYTTTDGGASWIRVPEVDIPAPTTGEYGITGNYCAVGDHIWWGTNKGRMFRSSDKGYTWEVSMTAFGDTETVNAVFADELNGIVYRSYLNMGIQPDINVTDDGGITWSMVTVSGNMYARYFSYVPGTSQTYVGSSSDPSGPGTSYSFDGGYSWITLNDGDPIQSSVWLDTETGWAGTWATATGGMLIFDSSLNVSTGFVSGTVLDNDTSTPVEGALITMGSFSTETNIDGVYEMQLDTGTYTLTCELEGYETYTQDNVEIIEDQTTMVNIQLQHLYNPPQNLEYMISGSNVTLTFQSPLGGFGLTNYYVYRNEAIYDTLLSSATYYLDLSLPTGIYTYYLTALYFDTYESVPSNEVTVEVVSADGSLLPVDTELIGNYPNPFNPSTTIYFTARNVKDAKIVIYNVKGQKIKSFDIEQSSLSDGKGSVVWNGKDDNGKSVTSGIYFSTIDAKRDDGDFTSMKKMILLK